MAARSRPKPPTESLDEHFAKSKAKFLKVLRAQLAENPPRYNPSEAAKVIDYSRSTPYRWAEKDPEFNAKWRDIAEAFADSLEDRMVSRAWEGSDVLMIFFLKALRPEKYRERYEHTGSQAISVTYTNDWRGGTPLQEVPDARNTDD